MDRFQFRNHASKKVEPQNIGAFSSNIQKIQNNQVYKATSLNEHDAFLGPIDLMLVNKNSVQSPLNLEKKYSVTSSFKIQNWHELAIHQYILKKENKPLQKNLPDDIGLLHSYLKIYDGKRTIEFSDQKAVISLTRCILKVIFDIEWTLPIQNLCPRVPNRLNYLIWIYRYIVKRTSLQNEINCKQIIGVDIGTGASLIYPLIGHKMFGWNFIATQIDEKSILHAKKLIEVNKLSSHIETKRSQANLLMGTICPKQKYTFTVCNPPFFDTSNVEKDPLSVMTESQHNIEGGQYEFFFSLYVESFHYPNIGFFTMMIGLGRNFETIKKFLSEEYREYGLLEEVKFGKINQSQNSRFIVAWKVKTT